MCIVCTSIEIQDWPGIYSQQCELNSSSPSAAYMHQRIGSALVQIITCGLIRAKPLSKSMLGYCQMTLKNKLHWHFTKNTKFIIQENASETIVCKMAAILSRGIWFNHNLISPQHGAISCDIPYAQYWKKYNTSQTSKSQKTNILPHNSAAVVFWWFWSNADHTINYINYNWCCPSSIGKYILHGFFYWR